MRVRVPPRAPTDCGNRRSQREESAEALPQRPSRVRGVGARREYVHTGRTPLPLEPTSLRQTPNPTSQSRILRVGVLRFRTMNLIETYRLPCPWCGRTLDLVVDCSGGSQEYVEDCAVCCQPIVVRVSLDGHDEPCAEVSISRENE
ncbi:MAG: CPXCG motif-containing cysteine-rich protein [Chromatiaceae bacterium]